MCPVILEWEQKPLVMLKLGDPNYRGVWWHQDLRSSNRHFKQISLGVEGIRIWVKLNYCGFDGGTGYFWVWIDREVNGVWQPVGEYPYFYQRDKHISEKNWVVEDFQYDIPVNERGFVKFRVRVSMKQSGEARPLHEDPRVRGSFNETSSATNNPRYNWDGDETNTPVELLKEFTVYVEHFGDFSLKYLPVTLLYCPPGQDMYSAFKQNLNYGTTTSMGFTESTGTQSGHSSHIRGGMNIGYGSLSGQSEATQGWSEERRSQLEESVVDKITYGYDWSTTLIADNQRVIGRRYWGPLGDIFVLLKNPWFGLEGDSEGNIVITSSELTNTDTQIVILPAHKLLRPNGDPIADEINWELRKRILRLDPFIINLEKFFPPPDIDPNTDPNIPLEEAVDPYKDPSAGYSDDLIEVGDNRAELIARYSISNGVELDLSMASSIQLSQQHTSSSSFYADVGTSTGFSSSITYKFVTGGASGEEHEGEFVNVGYYDSFEYYFQEVKTALCKLIRNQNQADLEDIEIWWDKQFSTFMFRKIKPGTGSIFGTVWSPGSIFTYIKELGTGINGIPGILINVGRIFEYHPEILAKLGINIPPDPVPPEVDPCPIYEGIAQQIIDTGLDLENILSKIDRNSTGIFQTTTTDFNGKYSFRNVEKGVYVLQFGDKVSKITMTDNDMNMNRFLKLDLLGVKRVIELRKVYLWELQQILNISLSKAKRIKNALEQEIHLNDESFTRILDNEKLSIHNLKKETILRFNDEKVSKGNSMIGGFIVNSKNYGIKNNYVYLISKSLLDEISPNFAREWPEIEVQPILKKLDKKSYYLTKTNPYGKYIIKNVRPDNYYLVSGNRFSEISVKKEEVETGIYKRIDLTGVKRVLNINEDSPFEFRASLGTSMKDAIRIKNHLQKIKDLDDTKLEEVLKGEKLSIDELKKNVNFRIVNKPEKRIK